MLAKKLAEAISLAGIVHHFFVSTADMKGVPHMAIADHMANIDDYTLEVTAWFCPRTAGNVDENPHVSIVVWNEQQDLGFQLIGDVIQVLDLAILNGFDPEEIKPIPQIERKLIVKVGQVLNFSRASHSDTDLL